MNPHQSQLYLSGRGDKINQLAHVSLMDGKNNTCVGLNTGHVQGANNTAVGAFAGLLDRSSQNTVLIGKSAGNASQHAVDTVAIGAGALGRGTRTMQSVFVGADSGKTARVASYVTAVGHAAGSSLSTAARSTFVGSHSGQLAFNTMDDTFVGYGSGRTCRDGARNACMGAFSGNHMETGAENVLVGYAAGANIVSAHRCVAVGAQALEHATNASNVIAIGTGAGRFASGARDAVFIGAGGTPADSTSAQTANCVYVGQGTGFAGSDNVGIGTGTLPAVTGADNTAVGGGAGLRLVTGNANVLLGSLAGANLTAESRNVCVGVQTGTVGNDNTTLGHLAGTAAAGSNNVTVGGYARAAGKGSYNTAVGATAAVGMEGNLNVVLGSRCGVGGTSDRGVFIGANAALTVAGADNIVIGADSCNTIQANGSIVLGTRSCPTLRGDSSVVLGSNVSITKPLYSSTIIGTNITESADLQHVANSVLIGTDMVLSNADSDAVVLHTRGLGDVMRASTDVLVLGGYQYLHKIDATLAGSPTLYEPTLRPWSGYPYQAQPVVEEPLYGPDNLNPQEAQQNGGVPMAAADPRGWHTYQGSTPIVDVQGRMYDTVSVHPSGMCCFSDSNMTFGLPYHSTDATAPSDVGCVFGPTVYFGPRWGLTNKNQLVGAFVFTSPIATVIRWEATNSFYPGNVLVMEIAVEYPSHNLKFTWNNAVLGWVSGVSTGIRVYDIDGCCIMEYDVMPVAIVDGHVQDYPQYAPKESGVVFIKSTEPPLPPTGWIALSAYMPSFVGTYVSLRTPLRVFGLVCEAVCVFPDATMSLLSSADGGNWDTCPRLLFGAQSQEFQSLPLVPEVLVHQDGPSTRIRCQYYTLSVEGRAVPYITEFVIDDASVTLVYTSSLTSLQPDAVFAMDYADKSYFFPASPAGAYRLQFFKPPVVQLSGSYVAASDIRTDILSSKAVTIDEPYTSAWGEFVALNNPPVSRWHGYNAQPFVRFDASLEQALVQESVSLGSTSTIVAVFRFTGAITPQQRVFELLAYGNGMRYFMSLGVNYDGHITFAMENQVQGHLEVSDSVQAAPDVWYTFIASRNSDYLYTQVDDRQEFTQVNPTMFSSMPVGSLAIGKSEVLGAFSNVDVHSLLVWNKGLAFDGVFAALAHLADPAQGSLPANPIVDFQASRIAQGLASGNAMLQMGVNGLRYMQPNRGSGHSFWVADQEVARLSLAKVEVLQRLQAGAASVETLQADTVDVESDVAHKTATATWTTASDYRVKSNVRFANLVACWDTVKALPLKEFDDAFASSTVVGWLAQDVKALLPNAVTVADRHGLADFHSLNPDQIIKTMYGALQKAIDRIEKLENTLQVAIERINGLEETIAALA